MQNQDLLVNDLSLSGVTKAYLAESAKWGKFLAIIGFIGCGFMAIGAFLLPVMMTMMPSDEMGMGMGMGMFAKGMGAALTIIYLALAFLFFIPCLYLFRFANKMKQALTQINEEVLEDSFRNLKSMFKFYAIMMIIILGIYALGIIIALIGGAFLAAS